MNINIVDKVCLMLLQTDCRKCLYGDVSGLRRYLYLTKDRSVSDS